MRGNGARFSRAWTLVPPCVSSNPVLSLPVVRVQRVKTCKSLVSAWHRQGFSFSVIKNDPTWDMQMNLVDFKGLLKFWIYISVKKKIYALSFKASHIGECRIVVRQLPLQNTHQSRGSNVFPSSVTIHVFVTCSIWKPDQLIICHKQRASRARKRAEATPDVQLERSYIRILAFSREVWMGSHIWLVSDFWG